jgi:hypothetical protein
MKIVKSGDIEVTAFLGDVDVLVIEDSDHIECVGEEFDEIAALVYDLVDSFERDRDIIINGLSSITDTKLRKTG